MAEINDGLECCALREVYGIQSEEEYVQELRDNIREMQADLKRYPNDTILKQDLEWAQEDLKAALAATSNDFADIVDDVRRSHKPFYIFTDNGRQGYKAGTALAKKLRTMGTVKVVGTKRNTTGSLVRMYVFMPDLTKFTTRKRSTR